MIKIPIYVMCSPLKKILLCSMLFLKTSACRNFTACSHANDKREACRDVSDYSTGVHIAVFSFFQDLFFSCYAYIETCLHAGVLSVSVRGLENHPCLCLLPPSCPFQLLYSTPPGKKHLRMIKKTHNTM